MPDHGGLEIKEFVVGKKPYSGGVQGRRGRVVSVGLEATYASVARDLGCNAETLRLRVWDARAGKAGARAREPGRQERGGGSVLSDAVLEQENRQLRQKVAELEAEREAERDILRRAAKYFAGETSW